MYNVFVSQIHRDFRKPLIVMAPKSLLRHKECKSNLSEFDDVQGHPGFDKQGTRFKRLIKDQNYHSDREEGIRRLVLCSGKVCSSVVFFTFISHHSPYKVFMFLFTSNMCFHMHIFLYLISSLTIQFYISLVFLPACFRSITSLMRREERSMARMLQFVGWSSSVLSHMTLSSVN